MNLKFENAVKDGLFWNEINDLAKEAFPPEEYLAPARLYEMSKDDDFDFLFVSDGADFVGFTVVQTYGKLAYLFFLAIDEKKRSKGYGGSTLRALKNAYPDKNFVVDFEMLDKTAENYLQRETQGFLFT